MSKLPFRIPPEVIDWIRDVFPTVNGRVSAKLTLRRIIPWNAGLDRRDRPLSATTPLFDTHASRNCIVRYAASVIHQVDGSIVG
ncbi:MAG: hypothetical protein JO356_08855 [Acidobacteria bacterium]|nr:hypothetical protein [Acidobacteriota bacterium]